MREFRSAIESRSLERVMALVADDVVFRSPVVYSPYRGRDALARVLLAARDVFEDFRYTREIGAPGAADHALVFRARVGDREVEGSDFIHTDADGLIDELYVMVRPLSAALAVAEAMGERLAAAGSGGPA